MNTKYECVEFVTGLTVGSIYTGHHGSNMNVVVTNDEGKPQYVPIKSMKRHSVERTQVEITVERLTKQMLAGVDADQFSGEECALVLSQVMSASELSKFKR